MEKLEENMEKVLVGMEIKDIKKIDFDFWSNAKKNIVLALEKKNSESKTQAIKDSKRCYSCGYRHLKALKKRGIVSFEKGTRKKINVSLKVKPEEAFFK